MQNSQALAMIMAAALLSEKDKAYERANEVRPSDPELKPIKNVNPQYRNNPCNCGSGKKYKKCCKI